MRVLLDENIPVDLSAELSPHAVDTVAGLGWAGIKNGELLRRMSGQYDALVTMDRNIEFQQVVSRQAFGVGRASRDVESTLRPSPSHPQPDSGP